MTGFGYNVNGFGVGGGGDVPLQWNNTYNRSVIAQQLGGNIRFGVPMLNATTSGVWQYKLGSGGSWTTFGSTILDVGADIIQTADGGLFRYILVSANWGAGNTNYIQRVYPSTDIEGNGYSFGETTSLANNAGNFGTLSNYSFF